MKLDHYDYLIVNLNINKLFAMEPLMSLEGFRILEDTQRSRELLNQFYEEQGYNVVKPKQTVEQPQEQNQNAQANQGQVR